MLTSLKKYDQCCDYGSLLLEQRPGNVIGGNDQLRRTALYPGGNQGGFLILVHMFLHDNDISEAYLFSVFLTFTPFS